MTTHHIIKFIDHNINLLYLVKVEEAVTRAPIGQTPQLSRCEDEIRNYLPEGCLQFVVEDSTSEDDTSEDEANVARALLPTVVVKRN